MRSGDKLIIGIPTDDGEKVSDHFGRSVQFLIATIENGGVVRKSLLGNPHDKEMNDQSGHGKLLKMLTAHKVNRVICSNINPKMQRNLTSLGINVIRCNPDSKIADILVYQQ